MALNIVLGKPKTGKSTYIYENIEKDIKNNKKFFKTLDFMAKIGYNIKEHKKTQKSRNKSYSSIVIYHKI